MRNTCCKAWTCLHLLSFGVKPCTNFQIANTVVGNKSASKRAARPTQYPIMHLGVAPWGSCDCSVCENILQLMLPVKWVVLPDLLLLVIVGVIEG